MKKKIWIVSIVVILMAALLFGYNALNKNKKITTAVQPTAKVTRTDLVVKVSGTGTVSSVNKATVNSSETGKIASIKFKEGQKVKKGETLVTFETEDMTSQIQKSELQIQQKQMDYEDLKKKYMDATEEERASMNTQIEQKKLDMQLAQIDLQDLKDKQAKSTVVTSPINGTIVTSAIHVGDQVSPNTVIAEITDYDNLESIVQVDELDVDKVKAGQKVQMTLDALSDQTVEGKVTAVSQEGTASNGVASFDVTVSITKNDSIKIGMSLQADIIVQSKENALVVPIEAVHQLGGKSFVQLASAAEGTTTGSTATGNKETGAAAAPSEQPQEDKSNNANRATNEGATNRAKNGNGNGTNRTDRNTMMQNMKEIEVGIHNESYIEVLSGLEEGEQILLPAVKASTGSSAQMNAGFGGLGGMGGGNFGGGQGGFRQSTSSGGQRTSGGGGSR
ncbi:hypothetical protein BVG16_06065 [Paenibacillus selenitireducens]|uniref:Uncharacterized protein n=1 Tax=Paenibacillus selenitireducens TaxID=1324314 RepID=A0A1T2XKE7_9BACL|nr:efflux RND transporter periplasmic adaptor subunit [Paenibacillus selenitireducens]OPA80298.1 hypothetical protein BVG16_06065 [Paenibacillus selenitireducens]